MVVVLTLMAFSHTKPEDAGTGIDDDHSLTLNIPILIPPIHILVPHTIETIALPRYDIKKEEMSLASFK